MFSITSFSWAGLYDGRYDNVTLKDLVLKDDKYAKVRENVGKCDVIIIDEVSMLSKKDFEQLEMVCRVVKGNGLIFGGIQLVVCGDFYQLPPVPNAMYNDSEEYCFESELWPLVFNHRINLDVIVRQSEPNLIKAVRETAIGKVSDETDKFLKSLNRDLPDDIEPTHLFARNIDADLYNNEKLGELKTPGKVYIAPKNIGPKRRLNKILAPQKLSLKIDCPVILLRNLGGKLVNGLRGRVKELNDNYITVYFEKIKETHKIERYTFTQYDINKKMNIAERLQFPLRLAYGLTIHKSQGLTLDSVYIHCGGIFQCGQFSVALGRARTSDTVQLENYHKGLCQQPKSAVTKFYGIQSEAFEVSRHLFIKDNVFCYLFPIIYI